MSVYKMNPNLITTITSPTVLGMKLTGLGGITVSGTTAYILKSCGKSTDQTLYPVAICKITNFIKSPKVTTISISKKIARHANDITYGDKHLFIATMNHSNAPQLIKVNTKGEIKKQYKYLKDGIYHSFSTCDYLEKDTFIVGTGTKDGKRMYDIAKIVGNDLIYIGVTFYSQPIPSNYTANATYYDIARKVFYNTFFERDKKGLIKSNHIFSYKLNEAHQLTLVNEFIVEAPKEYNKKFEIEGVITDGTIKYIACNCESTSSTYNKDGLFRLKKK